MARHGENIRKRKDGRWEGRFMVFDSKKGKKAYRSVYGMSYDEVRMKMTLQKNLLQDLSSKEQMSLSDIRFFDIAQEWIKQVKNQRKQSTYLKYSAVYHTHLEPFFQDAALSDFTDASVASKLPDHLSDSVCRSIYCVLNQILKYASRQYHVTVPVLKKTCTDIKKKTVRVLSQSEQKKLICVLYREMDRYKLALIICLFTGLRLGELCALKWSDIDADCKTLMVARTVQRLPVEGQKTKTALVETPPKSESSRREIPLSNAVFSLLMQFRENREYLFGGDKPLEPRTLQNHFQKIIKEAALEDKNFHMLRHTFATNCVEGGMDVKSLSEILGHSDVQTTLRLYVHPSMDTKRQGMDQIAQFYDRIRGQIQGQAG
ncbi:MAG: site-specific integrase [Lachnospiraceae bacterium]|nr:site-specific integrase [Lachnospiraceae bacterium]